MGSVLVLFGSLLFSAILANSTEDIEKTYEDEVKSSEELEKMKKRGETALMIECYKKICKGTR